MHFAVSKYYCFFEDLFVFIWKIVLEIFCFLVPSLIGCYRWAGSGQSQEPGVPVSHIASIGSDTWAIFLCFTESESRELGWKWNGQDKKQHSHWILILQQCNQLYHNISPMNNIYYWLPIGKFYEGLDVQIFVNSNC